MFNWLLSLLNSGAKHRKTIELEAQLVSVDGGNIFGEAEFELYSNNGWELEAEVIFRNGTQATPLTLWLNDREVLGLIPDDFHESEGKLSSRRGDRLTVLPTEGMRVDIKRDAATILSGTFELQSRFR